MSNLAARALSSFVNTLFVIQCWQCNVNWAARESCISQSPPKAQHEQQKKANESDNRREDWEYQFARHLFHYTAHSISPAIDGIIFYISHIYSYRSARQTNQCIGLKLICFSLLYNDFFLYDRGFYMNRQLTDGNRVKCILLQQLLTLLSVDCRAASISMLVNSGSEREFLRRLCFGFDWMRVERFDAVSLECDDTEVSDCDLWKTREFCSFHSTDLISV